MADNMTNSRLAAHDADDDPLTVKLCEIEFQSRTGSNTSQHTMWLISMLRATMAENQSLLRGIAKSAELLGDALDTVDLPDRLVDDLSADWSASDSDSVDGFEDLFDDPLDEIEERR